MNYHWTGNNSAGLNGAIISLQFTAAGATFSGFSVAYTAASDKVNAITGTWSYSIGNSGLFTALSPEAIAVGPTATPNNDILGGINLANNQVLHLRFAFSATSANNGSDDFNIDNLILSANITPVPEPVNVALCSFAVICLGVTAGRRFLARRSETRGT